MKLQSGLSLHSQPPSPHVHRVAACDLILEYTLSAAAIAKGFTAYMASLCGADLQKIRLQVRWPAPLVGCQVQIGLQLAVLILPP